MKQDTTSGKTSSPIRIVLVEDEPLILRMYQQKLEQDGYLVYTASNGEDGFDLVEEHFPDLVLCDIMMPGTSGLQLLGYRSASEDERIRNIPIIMLTNLASDELVQTALKLGADDYVVKSQTNPKEVLDKVREILADKLAPGLREAA